MVKTNFVRAEQFTGKHKLMVMINNTVVRAPVAVINIDTPYLSGEVEVMCLEDAIYDLIRGNVPGARLVNDQDPTWKPGGAAASVGTRAEVRNHTNLRKAQAKYKQIQTHNRNTTD